MVVHAEPDPAPWAPPQVVLPSTRGRLQAAAAGGRAACLEGSHDAQPGEAALQMPFLALLASLSHVHVSVLHHGQHVRQQGNLSPANRRLEAHLEHAMGKCCATLGDAQAAHVAMRRCLMGTTCSCTEQTGWQRRRSARKAAAGVAAITCLRKPTGALPHYCWKIAHTRVQGVARTRPCRQEQWEHACGRRANMCRKHAGQSTIQWWDWGQMNAALRVCMLGLEP